MIRSGPHEQASCCNKGFNRWLQVSHQKQYIVSSCQARKDTEGGQLRLNTASSSSIHKRALAKNDGLYSKRGGRHLRNPPGSHLSLGIEIFRGPESHSDLDD